MTALRRFGLLAPLAALSLAGCGLNSVPTAEEQVNADFGQPPGEYQRRNDLIRNLVETVKGYAAAGTRRADPGDRGARQRDVGAAQRRATSTIRQRCALQRGAGRPVGRAISRCTADQEAYPELRAKRDFGDLRRSSKAPRTASAPQRRDYNEAVRSYNTRIRTFPDAIGAKIFYGAKPKVPFEAAAGAQIAPKVDF